MVGLPELDRISAAGVDVLRVAQTSVLIKIDDVAVDRLHLHPLWPLCRALSAMGFGAIHLRGAADYFDELDRVMQGSHFTQLPGVWITEELTRKVPAANVVVDLTNDRESKSLCARLCTERSAHLISFVLGRTWVSVGLGDVHLARADILPMSPDQGEPCLAPVSRIAAGLALQEILSLAAPIELAAALDREVFYDVGSGTRTARNERVTWPGSRVEEATIDVIGAGGIGVHLLESLAPMLGPSSEIRIFDPDHVGSENLASQILYTREDVGRPKAIAAAERLRGVCGSLISVTPFAAWYQERPVGLPSPSLRVVCPDNFAARKYANDLSVADGIPLVEAGSSPLAAQQRTYYPGRTACLEHRIPGLAEKAAHEKGRSSCSEARALTLPGTNMVIGGVLAAEAVRALRPDTFGWPSQGAVVYDGRVAKRFGIVDVRPPCQHGRVLASHSDLGIFSSKRAK